MPITVACPSEPEARRLAKRILWLAYEASVPMGAGQYHYREGLTEEEVWGRCPLVPDRVKPQTCISADYLVGRMMKLYFTYSGGIDQGNVTIDSPGPRQDYQSWCTTYKTYEALVEAAQVSLKAEDSIVNK